MAQIFRLDGRSLFVLYRALFCVATSRFVASDLCFASVVPELSPRRRCRGCSQLLAAAVTTRPFANGGRSMHLIYWKELEQLLGYCRMHVDRLEKADKFPRRIKLGT